MADGGFAADAGQVLGPDGTVTFDFTGHVHAKGIDLDSLVIGAPGVIPTDQMVRWIAPDGSVVGAITTQPNGALSIYGGAFGANDGRLSVSPTGVSAAGNGRHVQIIDPYGGMGVTGYEGSAGDAARIHGPYSLIYGLNPGEVWTTGVTMDVPDLGPSWVAFGSSQFNGFGSPTEEPCISAAYAGSPTVPNLMRIALTHNGSGGYVEGTWVFAVLGLF